MNKPTEAYPLSWPAGWRRTAASGRIRARFSKQTFIDRGMNEQGQQLGYRRRGGISIREGTDRVLKVLEQMRFGSSVIISSNLTLRNNGMPRSGQSEPGEPGVAVYWGSGNKMRCMAVDRYDRTADNLAAIAATLEAMRAIERHGGATILDRAFAGFIALPAPEQPWQVLGVKHDATDDEIELAYRRLASEHHPDKGGDPAMMARINAARAALNESAESQSS